MIYYLNGPVTVLEPGLAVVECGGVGYGCRITAFTAAQLKLNQTARLYICESIREDAHDLYGFASREEQRCYELLTSVTGVGPKAAMAILSYLTPDRFAYAVCTEDVKALSRAPGVGSKTAARIVLELKDKISKEQMQGDLSSLTDAAPAAKAPASGVMKEAADALAVLGYSRSELSGVLAAIDPAGKTLEGVITEALRRFSQG